VGTDEAPRLFGLGARVACIRAVLGASDVVAAAQAMAAAAVKAMPSSAASGASA
jgi:hypothetical protein